MLYGHDCHVDRLHGNPQEPAGLERREPLLLQLGANLVRATALHGHHARQENGGDGGCCQRLVQRCLQRSAAAATLHELALAIAAPALFLIGTRSSTLPNQTDIIGVKISPP